MILREHGRLQNLKFVIKPIDPYSISLTIAFSLMCDFNTLIN